MAGSRRRKSRGCGGCATPATSSSPTTAAAPTWAAPTAGRDPRTNSPAPVTPVSSVSTVRSWLGLRRGPWTRCLCGSRTVSYRCSMASSGAYGWLQDRLNVDLVWRSLFIRKIPFGVNLLYTLGFASLAVFLVQIVTGTVLALYYSPSPH